MSFLSDIHPLWSHTAGGGSGPGEADLELGRAREKHKTWTAVKLPSIPLELSEGIAQSRPCSRAVRTATKRDTAIEDCLFCGNQTCKAKRRADGEEDGRRPRTRERRHKDFKFDTPKIQKAVIGNMGATQSELSPRSLLEPTAHVMKSVDSSSKEGALESGWEPFSCKCQFCGKKFGKHSVVIHERRCNKRGQPQPPTIAPRRLRKLQKVPQESSGLTSDGIPQKVATIITMGLSSGIEKSTVYATLPPRPQTRTLHHSTLRSSGYGMPLASKEHRKFRETSSSVQCEQCQQIVATDRMSIHSRLCKASVPAVSPCDVVFPSMCDLLRVDDNPAATGEKSPPKPRKPPTKVCYICGREFGSQSIAIHEPQCLKKWHAENRKLPISERKPVPKKRESKPTIVRTLSGDALGKIDSLPDKDEALKEKLVQMYFENCYSEFEKDLIPCKKCGRTFAPERHRIHEQNCNAKPIACVIKKS